jgi:ribonuclease HI
MPDDQAIAYTDGSCIGNPGPGGWGVHVQFPDGRVLERGGGELETTNNRMELRAAIEAVRLTATCRAVTVITDSQYVRRGVTQWLAGWKEKGWQRLRGRAVENQELWSELDDLADDRVTWEWTRGHVGTVGNERADAIAGWFASGIKQLGIPSGYPPRRSPPGVSYLSLVDGVLARHATWADCERRVHGVKGARFKKVRSTDDERAAIAAWGLPPDALEWM